MRPRWTLRADVSVQVAIIVSGHTYITCSVVSRLTITQVTVALRDVISTGNRCGVGRACETHTRSRCCDCSGICVGATQCAGTGTRADFVISSHTRGAEAAVQARVARVAQAILMRVARLWSVGMIVTRLTGT